MLFMRQDYENNKNYHQIKQCLKDIELCDTLRQHIHKENHILYPMVDTGNHRRFTMGQNEN